MFPENPLRSLIVFLFAVAAISGGAIGKELTQKDIPTDASPQVKKLIEQTFSGSATIRWAAAHSLGKLGEAAAPAVPFLVRILTDRSVASLPPGVEGEGEPLTVGLEAGKAITRIGEPGVQACLDALEESDPASFERRLLVEQLGHLRDPRVVQPLIRQLSEPNPELRETVLDVLVYYKGPLPADQLLPLLLPALKDDFRFIKKNTIKLLGKLGSPQAVAPLMEHLNDSGINIRSDVIHALGRIDDPEVLKLLLQILQDPSESEGSRECAAEGLGNFSSPAVDRVLVAVFRDRRERVWIRVAAAYAMKKSRDPQIPDVLLGVLQDRSEDSRVRKPAIVGASMKEDQTVSILLPFARDKTEHWRVRFAAACCLVTIAEGRIDDLALVEGVERYSGPGKTLAESDEGDCEHYRMLKLIAKNGKTWEVRLAARGGLRGVPCHVYERKHHIIYPAIAVLYYGLAIGLWALCYRRRLRQDRKGLWDASLLVLMAVGIPLVLKGVYLWFPMPPW